MNMSQLHCRIYRTASFVHVFDSVIEWGSCTVYRGEYVNTEPTRPVAVIQGYLQHNQFWNIIAPVRVLHLRTISDIEELNYVVRVIEATKEIADTEIMQTRNLARRRKPCSKYESELEFRTQKILFEHTVTNINNYNSMQQPRQHSG